MTADTLHRRLESLDAHPALLTGIQRGIEREGLRTDGTGQLAMTPHAASLGSALTHPRITTDYSEALLELITGVHGSTDALFDELGATHRYVQQNLGTELLWAHSMPAGLPGEAQIPIAWYGTSHSGMLKHVYRRGLAERYGKVMQCIAGLHYNFSLPETFWDTLGYAGDTSKSRRSSAYIALIRNFSRYSWLLMYLFGASPAASSCFLEGRPHHLQRLDRDTWFLPHATSLRMSDLGYQNEAQSRLKPCYNDLDTFIARLREAVTEPWPAYEAIGTHRDGEWIQLNTYILQIENEYYSAIRPKQTAARGERPLTALSERGIQYIEVRCLDLDPYEPLGIGATTSHFLDAFLLYCALLDSPHCGPAGFCQTSADNFKTVVEAGRRPGLMLARNGETIALTDWGHQLLDGILLCAQRLDAANGGTHHADAVTQQRAKIDRVDLTPSARVLNDLQQRGISLHQHALELSRRHADTLRAQPLPAGLDAQYRAMALTSLDAQVELERTDTGTFDEYVARYERALPGATTSAS